MRALRFSLPIVGILSAGLLLGAQSNQQAGSKPETKAPPPQKRQRVTTDVSKFELAPASKVAQSAGVAGATRGTGDQAAPVALAPRLTRLYGPSPVFIWSFGPKVRQFVFILTDEDQEEIYRADVTRAQFQYPNDAPRLEPGKTYYWYVEPQPKALGMTRSEPAGFQVISGAELKAVEQKLAEIGASESFESGLARAQLFRDHGLWYDALSAYSELIERNPNQAELYQQRGAIYAQLEPTKDLAERDLARAREAGKQ